MDVALSTSPDLIKNIPLEMACDYIGVVVDSEKTAGKNIAINFVAEDTGEERSLTLKNGVVNSRPTPIADPDLTLKGPGAALNGVLLGGIPNLALGAGGITATGRVEALDDLLSMMTKFKYWFPIITRPTTT